MDQVIHTVKELVTALEKLAPVVPFAQVSDKQLVALQDLSNIFIQATAAEMASPPRVERVQR